MGACLFQSTKSRKFIKFSPRLRKKSRAAKENAVKDMEAGGAAGRDLVQHLPNGLNDKEKQGESFSLGLIGIAGSILVFTLSERHSGNNFGCLARGWRV